MSAPSAYVYVDLDGVPHFAGRLWATAAKGRESATFEYDSSWLKNPERFALEPALTLDPGPHHTGSGRAMFGALGDSAPDRWGRTLIARAERHRAKSENRRPRSMREVDYLLGVTDEVRQGALRFALSEGGPFVTESDRNSVPPLLELPALLAATEHVLDDEETDDDLRLLLAPGSSLGGARPKASVRERGGALLIAKFPAKADDLNVVRWEAIALSLARRGGITVPDWRLKTVSGRDVILVRRFDRNANVRIPFLSAMSALGGSDGDIRSYLEIADVLRQFGSAVSEDLPALWRRIVFNVLISNTDDHLRNHGFLYAGSHGWRLAPAYDMNPVPVDIKPRFLSTAIGIDDDLTASLDIAMEVARDFALKPRDARKIAREVAKVVLEWRVEAKTFRASHSEMDRMASAFEHVDLEKALQ